MESNCNMPLLEFIKQFSGKHHSLPPDDVNNEALEMNMKITDDIIVEVIMRSGGGM